VRIIDADELVKTALTESCFDSRTEDVFLDLVDSMPTVDAKTTFEAEPVRHGRWVKDGDFLVCLNCESEINVKNSLGVENRKNYCPNCGKPMDGGVSDED
jgi:hypothetical protein